MKKIVCLFLVGFMFQTVATAQKMAFKDGEKLTFTASYKMSGFMTQLAQVSMETSEVKTSKNTLLHFKSRATTYKKFDAFFKIRDMYESYVSKASLLPVLYRRDIQEGNYKKKMKYVYNQRSKTIKSTQTKRRGDGTDWIVNKNFSFSNQAMDVVSTLYNLRNLPIESARVGDTKTFKIIFDRKETPVTIKYVGKETVNAGNLGSKECYKLQVLTSGEFLKSGTLWLTADANKVPVQARFTIPIGSGMLQLTNASGLAN
ncbi:DUF3108 domain-containing protein [Kordia algicida OT-1]|uniref:DUF3108 domain-containing protein n=1 Tax=Kordia algicida OT-1 TaxID=391587 RepID=A9EAH9_9FLAO|nr:DUF3108 domain-containing protein [Kordia algicida]EDP94632.1 hypothetical protein KAOT1_04425 [Kordia algicida OT-1]